ncbi:hypothetical protein ACJJIQ_06190 [Microbulbifer sp. ANSA003]|uniref:hypothetical protein n=1 Tax=Microbulbifer sp. ANSA003 TaxID=3243360 RepID=UPI004041F339
MVAIISGDVLGLFNSTKTGIGSASFGQGRESVYVNASTGNLVLRQQDEFVAAAGLDLSMLRTYNSQGQMDGDNNDGFRFNFSNQLINLIGSPGQTGSQVTRIGGDGSETIYQFDAHQQAYVSSDGAGAHDQIIYDSGSNQWVWREGSSRSEEVYGQVNGEWKMVARVDAEGRQLVFGHNSSGLVDSITDAAGQSFTISYSGSKVTGVSVSTDGAAQQRLYYSYDSQGRLDSVTVDLTPQDNSIADGNVYRTEYTYDGSSNRVHTIEQSDGSYMVFMYVDVDGLGDYRVSEVRSGRHSNSGLAEELDGSDRRITTYSYDLENNTTKITQVVNPESDASSWIGPQTELVFDGAGRVIELKAPADQNGVRESTQYSYDDEGNLTSKTDHSGNTTVYEYDSRGNQTLLRDGQGNTLEREYDSYNQLIKETVYLQPDPDGDGEEMPADPRVTHYVYDDMQRLRYVVGHDGTVQETRYDDATATARTISSITYLHHGYFDQFLVDTYTQASVSYDIDFSLSALNTWAQETQADILSSELENATRRSDTRLDFRGQVYSVTDYSTVDVNGDGVLDGTESTSYTVYDARGQLLHTVDPRGTGADSSSYKTSYVYDGLGRLLSSTDAKGYTSASIYNDAQSQIISTDANGLQVTRTYATNGSLISEVYHDTREGLSARGQVQYFYDHLGRIRATQDAAGAVSHSLYDDKGQMVAVISASGAITEFHYDAEGRQIQTTHYSTPVSGTQLQSLLIKDGDALVGIEESVSLEDLRPAANSSADRATYQYYDDADRVRFFVDAEGYLSETLYTAQGEVLSSTRYNLYIEDPAAETTDSLEAKYASNDASLTVASRSATHWVEPVQSYAQADSPGFNQRDTASYIGSVDLDSSPSTRTARNDYTLYGTVYQRVENTQTESVSGSAITTAYTRAPVQPYTYASSAIVAEEYTAIENHRVSVLNVHSSRSAEPPAGMRFDGRALRNVDSALTSTEDMDVYRQHTKVSASSSRTALAADAFSSASARTGTNYPQIFQHFKITVEVSRNDGESLPSGYNDTFSYTSTSRDFDGSIKLTDHYGDNLPTGSYEVKVTLEEVFKYRPTPPPGGYDSIEDPELSSEDGIGIDATEYLHHYTSTKSFNVGSWVEWTDPSTGENHPTVFEYKKSGSSDSEYSEKTITTFGSHKNRVTFDGSLFDYYDFKISYSHNDKAKNVGVGTFQSTSDSNQIGKDVVFYAQREWVSNSSALTGLSVDNVKTIVATTEDVEDSSTSYRATTNAGEIYKWDSYGIVNLRIGAKIPDGKYTVTLKIFLENGSIQTVTYDYEQGTQHSYDRTKIKWASTIQPESTDVEFEYRRTNSDANPWISAAPYDVDEGANQQVTLDVLDNGDYEFRIKFYKQSDEPGGELILLGSSTDTFTIDKSGTSDNNSSVDADFEFDSTRYITQTNASGVTDYFSRNDAETIKRVEVRVRDKVSGDLVSSSTAVPADYVAWVEENDGTFSGFLNLSEDGELENGRYEVEVTTYDLSGDEIDTNTFDYEIGDQTEYHPTEFRWPASSRPEGTSVIFEYEHSPGDWRSVLVNDEGSDLKVVLGDVDEGSITEGNYHFRIRYEKDGQTVKQTIGDPTLTVDKGVAKTSDFDFQYTTVSLQEDTGVGIIGYPVTIGSSPALQKIVAEVRDQNNQLISSAETWPQLYGSYNGEVNLSVGSDLPPGQAYRVTLTLYYDDDSTVGKEPFTVEIGEQPAQDRVIHWSDPNLSSHSYSRHTFNSEDSFNINHWSVYDTSPAGATVTQVYDSQLQRSVVEVSGTGTDNGFKLGINEAGDSWNITDGRVVRTEIQFSSEEHTRLYYTVTSSKASNGVAYVSYSSSVSSPSISISATSGSIFYSFPLEAQYRDGNWHVFERDIVADVASLDPDEQIQSINNLLVRGSGRIGRVDIVNWSDAGLSAQSFSRYRYNTADNFDLGQWQVGDNDPAGATLTQVYDPQLQRSVVEFSGNGTDNRFDLSKNAAGESWNITDGGVVRTEIQHSGEGDLALFYKLGSSLASNGVAYATYHSGITEPEAAVSSSGTIYYKFPLEDQYLDGNWHTFERDIRADVNSLDANEYIQAIDKLLVRGSGRIGTVEIDSVFSAQSGGLNIPRHVLNSGENLDVNSWEIYDSTPAGATIDRVYDEFLQRDVVAFSGTGTSNGFKLHKNAAHEAWNISDSAQARIEVNLQGDTYLYFWIETSEGGAYLKYNPFISSPFTEVSESGTIYYNLPLDSQYLDGNWHAFERDLRQDLATLAPDVELLEVDRFLVRGSGRIGAITLGEADEVTYLEYRRVGGSDVVRHSYNNGDNLDMKQWRVSDSSPAGATVTEVYDTQLQRKVVETSGDSANNAFSLSKNADRDSWDIADGVNASVEMQYAGEGEYRIYYKLDSSKAASGIAYAKYDSEATEPYIQVVSGYIYYTFPLDDKYLDGNWHTFERDILADIAYLDPTEEIQAFHEFTLRGNGRIGTVEITTDTPVSGENPWQRVAVQQNGDHFSANLGNDLSGDYEYRVVTYRDGVTDYVGYTYNSADNLNLDHWDIYSNSSETAALGTVYDSYLQREVVEISAQGIDDGFRLYSNTLDQGFGVTDASTVSAQINLSAPAVLYYRIETSAGSAYVEYRSDISAPEMYVSGGGITYYRLPLGAEYLDGNWHTFERDIRADIAQLDADVELESVDAFLVRGSGRIGTIEIGTNRLDSNRYGDNDRLLRSLSGTFAANDSGITPATWEMPTYHRSTAEGYAVEGYLSAEEAAAIAYMEAVVIDNATGTAIGAPVQTWIDPATLRDGSFAGRLNLLMGATLPDGDYTVQVTRYYNDGTSLVDDPFQQQVGRQLQMVENPRLTLALDPSYSASGMELSIRSLPEGEWVTLPVDAENGTVELDKDFYGSGVYEYRLSYTLDVDGVAVSKSGEGRFTLAPGDSYTQYLSATASGVDLADARISRTFYDEAGRVSGTLDQEGYLTEYRYNRAGQLVATTRYANRVASYSESAHWLNSGTLKTLRPVVDAQNDRTSYWIYDAQGREVAEIDAEGYLSEHQYDVAGNRVKTIRYASALNGLDNALDAVNGDASRLTLKGLNFIQHRFNEDNLDLGSWDIYAQNSGSATIEKVYDIRMQREVVELSGSGTNDGFKLYKNAAHEQWNIEGSASVRLEMNLSAPSRIFFSVETSKGYAFIEYSSQVTSPGIYYSSSGTPYYQFPLDASYLDGNWHAFERDLQADLASLDPDVELLNIGVFLVRGSGRIGTLEVTTETTGRLVSSDDDQVSEWRYDSRNQVTHSTDVYGNTSHFTYTADGQLQSSRSGLAITSGSILDNYLDNYQGDATFSANDSAARDAHWEYDVHGRVTGEWDHLGRQVKGYSYDAAGRRLSSTDANGYTTYYAYTEDGQLKYTIAPVFKPGSETLEWQVSQLAYSVFGELTRSRQYANRLSDSLLHSLNLNGNAAQLDSLVEGLASDGDTVTSSEYNQRGLLMNSTDGEGFTSTSTYNAFGERTHLSQAIDRANSRFAQTDFSYSRRGEVLTSSTHLSYGAYTAVTTSSEYNAFGQVQATADARGNQRAYFYDRLGQVVEERDALGQSTQLSYDAYGRVLTRTDALNRTTIYSYDDVRRSQKMTTPQGVHTETLFTIHGETLEVSLYANGSWHRQARYEYDTQGNLVSTENGLGEARRSEYDAAGQLTATLDERGVRTEIRYDPQGRVLTRTEDVGGLNLTTTQRYGHRFEETVDASGSVTRTEFDHNGRVVRVIVDASSDNSGLNLLTEFDYDGQGNLLQMREGYLSGGVAGTASYTRTRVYSYDELGRVQSETVDPDGLAIATHYQYDRDGNRTAVTNALGHTSYTVYDAEGRAVYTLSASGNPDNPQYTLVQSQYNAAGELVGKVQYGAFLDSADLPANIASGAAPEAIAALLDSGVAQRSTRYIYNGDGQLTYTIDSLGQVSETRYDVAGRVSAEIRYAHKINPSTESVDDLVRDTSLDRETRYQYDAAGRQTHRLQVFERDGAQYAYVTETLYTARGEVAGEITYARAIALASETTADLDPNAANNRRSLFIYDASGRRTHSVDSLGYVTETRYSDSDNRETVIRYANRISVPAVADWGSLRAGDLSIGSSSATDQVFVTQYDSAGRKTSITEQVWNGSGLSSFTEYYGYDALGNRTEITDQLGYKSYLSYDAAGRLTHQLVPRNGSQGYLSTWNYDALGQVLTETHYSQAIPLNSEPSSIDTGALAHAQDRSTRYTYSARGEVVLTIDSADVMTEQRYTAFGETWLTIEAKGLPEQRVTYRGFDALGRLVEETAGLPDAESGTIANRATLGEADLGRHERIATTYFSYNHFDELATLVSPRGEIYVSAQEHDQLGRKVAEVDARGSSTHSVLDAFGNIVATTDPNGNTGIFIYDANNRLTHQVLPNGGVTTYEYDAFGQATAVRSYAEKLAGDVDIAALDAAALDALLSGKQDVVRDRYITNSYDNRGQLLSTTQYGYDLIASQAIASETRYEYDAAGNRTAAIDALGARTDYQFDAQGRITQETGPQFAAALSAHSTATREVRAITEYVYNAFDRVEMTQGRYWDVSAASEKTDSQGLRTTEMAYDHRSRMITSIGPEFAAASNSALSTPDFDGAIGQVTLRQVTEVRYDALGRQVYEGQRGLSGAALNSDGSVSGTQHGQIQAVASVYNRLDQQVLVLDADGGLTFNVYTAAGNLTTEVRYDQRLHIDGSTWDGSAAALDLDSASGHWRHDALALQDRELTTGRSTHFYYNANNLLVRTESDEGIFFDLNNLVDPDSTSGDQGELQEGFSHGSTQGYQVSYDANGNSIIQIDGKDQPSFALFDAAGNQVLVVDRLGYVTESVYDGLGQVIAQTRYAMALNFDGLGAPADNEARHAWLESLYNDNRDGLIANLTSEEYDEELRTTEYVYSGRGLLLEERLKGESFSRISNSGTALSRSQVSSDLVTRYGYNETGLQDTAVRYDGDENASDSRTESVSYNALGQQAQTQGAEYTDYSGDRVRATVSYHYDLYGNRTAETVHNDGDQVTSHRYNALGVRTETRDARENRGDANYQGTTEFVFDAFGHAVYQTSYQTDIDNQQTQVVTWLQYDAQGRETARVSSADQAVGGGLVQHDIAYNTHGQIVGKGINTANRTGFAEHQYQEYFVYDELGRLFKTNSGNGTPRIYLYDQNGNTTLEISAINNDGLEDVTTVQQALNETTQSETQWKYSLYDQEDQLITVVEAPLDTPDDNPNLDVGWNVDNDGSETQNEASYGESSGSVPTVGVRNRETTHSSSSSVWVDLGSEDMPASTSLAASHVLTLPAARSKTTERSSIYFVDDEGRGYTSNPGDAEAVDSANSWLDNTDELFYLSEGDPRLEFEAMDLTTEQRHGLDELIGNDEFLFDGSLKETRRGYIEKDTLRYVTNREVTLDSGRTITVQTIHFTVVEQLHVFVPLSHDGVEYGWREVVVTTQSYNYDVTSNFLQAGDDEAADILDDAQNNPLALMPSLDWALADNTLSLTSADVADVFGSTAKVQVLAKNAEGAVVMDNTQYDWSDGMEIALAPGVHSLSLTFLSPDGLVLHAVDLYSSGAATQEGSFGLPGEGVGLEHLPEVNTFWLSAGYKASKQGSGQSIDLSYSDSLATNETTYGLPPGSVAASYPGQVEAYGDVSVTYDSVQSVVLGSEPTGNGDLRMYEMQAEITFTVSGLRDATGAELNLSIGGNSATVIVTGNGTFTIAAGFYRAVTESRPNPAISVSMKTNDQSWGHYAGDGGATYTSPERVKVYALPPGTESITFAADGETRKVDVPTGQDWVYVDTSDMDNSATALDFELWAYSGNNQTGTLLNHAKGQFNNDSGGSVSNITNEVLKTVDTNTYTRSASSDGDANSSVFYSQVGMYNRQAVRNIALQLTGAANDETLIAHHASYNAFGETVASIDNNGNATLYQYDKRGNVVQELKPEADVYTEQMTHFRAHTATVYGVNAYGETVMEKVAAQAAAGASSATRTAVDNYNIKHEQVSLQDYAAGLLVASQDAVGDYDTQAFDQAGNLKGTSQLAYRAGERGSGTGALYYQVAYHYDANNQLVRMNRFQDSSRAIDYNYGASAYYDEWDYDEFGNRIRHRNALYGDTRYVLNSSFDNTGDASASGTVGQETYRYDGLGRVLEYTSYSGQVTDYAYAWSDYVTRSVLAASGEQAQDDAIQVRLGGYITSVARAGMGGTVAVNWSQSSREDVITDVSDYFGKAVWHDDLGGHRIEYSYNYAGWLSRQTGNTGMSGDALWEDRNSQDIRYTYYHNGNLFRTFDYGNNGLVDGDQAAVGDTVAPAVTEYRYDKAGNRTGELYYRSNDLYNNNGRVVYQHSNAEYDEQGRIVSIEGYDEYGNAYQIDYTFDAFSNRRSVSSVYNGRYVDNLDGTIEGETQSFYYTYDKNNRFTLTLGEFQDGQIVMGESGTAISYNGLDQRYQAVRASDGSIREQYAYDANGRVTTVHIDQGSGFVLRAQRVNNHAGQVTASYEYDSDGTLFSVTENHHNADGTLLGYQTTRYDDSGRATDEVTRMRNTFLGDGATVDTSITRAYPEGGAAPTVTTLHNSYEKWDTYKTKSVVINADNADLTPEQRAQWESGEAYYTYDSNGHIRRVYDVANESARAYVTDKEGRTLVREEIRDSGETTLGREMRHFYYFNGHAVGDVGNDRVPSRYDYVKALAETDGSGNRHLNDNGDHVQAVQSADFDQNFQPINPSYPAASYTSYEAQGGESLQTIAATIWGDSSLWYLLADANGLRGDEVLTRGQRLELPNVVTNIHNNADTFRPVDGSLQLGDISPTLPDVPPPPPVDSDGCGLAVMIVLAVAVVAAIFLGPWVYGAVSGALAGAGPVVAGAAGAFASGAAVASATQVASMAVGLQSGFDWSGVAKAGVTSMVTFGVMEGLGSLSGAEGSIGSTSGFLSGNKVGAAITENAIGQGINMAFDDQHSFNWGAVAVAGVSGAIQGGMDGNFEYEMSYAARTYGAANLNNAEDFLTQASDGWQLTKTLLSTSINEALNASVWDQKFSFASVAQNAAVSHLGYALSAPVRQSPIAVEPLADRAVGQATEPAPQHAVEVAQTAQQTKTETQLVLQSQPAAVHTAETDSRVEVVAESLNNQRTEIGFCPAPMDEVDYGEALVGSVENIIFENVGISSAEKHLDQGIGTGLPTVEPSLLDSALLWSKEVMHDFDGWLNDYNKPGSGSIGLTGDLQYGPFAGSKFSLVGLDSAGQLFYSSGWESGAALNSMVIEGGAQLVATVADVDYPEYAMEGGESTIISTEWDASKSTWGKGAKGIFSSILRTRQVPVDPIFGWEHAMIQQKKGAKQIGSANSLKIGVSFGVPNVINKKNAMIPFVPAVDVTHAWTTYSSKFDAGIFGKAVYAGVVQTPINIFDSFKPAIDLVEFMVEFESDKE